MMLSKKLTTLQISLFNISNMLTPIALMFAISMGMSGCKEHHDSGSSTTVIPPENSASDDSSLKIIHINDHHSHLDEERMEFDLNTGSTSGTYSVSRGGFARVTALFNQLALGHGAILKLHAGDATTGDLYYNLTKGKADADVMNTICFDAFTLGNHEFDNKDQGLKYFIDALDQSDCPTRTAILSANVEFGPSSPLYQSTRIQKSTVIETQGQKIGLVGLTIAQKTKNASQPNPDTLFKDELESAQQQIDLLRQAGINKIILQSHVGYEMDKYLATQLHGVDVIVGGDSHTLLGSQNLEKVGMTPEAPYPTTLQNKDGDPVCIVQAWQYSYVVGELDVTFDSQGRVKNCQGTPHILIGDDFKPKLTSAPALTHDQQLNIAKQLHLLAPEITVIEPDSRTSQILSPYRDMKEKFRQTIVATAQEILCLRRVPGTQRDINRSSLGNVCNQDERVNRYGGDIQQLVAEAFLQQGKTYFSAQLSILNGGGVRTDVEQGPISVEKVYQVLPYNSTLVQLNMQGNEIKATLEDAVDAVITLNNTGSYPYTAGLRWSVDFNQPKGQRISNIELKDSSGEYSLLMMDQTYRVVTLDFLANGSDYYHTLATIRNERRIDVGLDYAEAFMKYLEADGLSQPRALFRLPVSNYSTQHFIDRPL